MEASPSEVSGSHFNGLRGFNARDLPSFVARQDWSVRYTWDAEPLGLEVNFTSLVFSLASSNALNASSNRSSERKSSPEAGAKPLHVMHGK